MNVEVRRSTSHWPLRRPQRWYVVIKAGNGRVLFTSELFVNRLHAVELSQTAQEWFA